MKEQILEYMTVSTGIICATIAFVFVVFTLSSCQIENEKLSQGIKEKCVSLGGSVIPTTRDFICLSETKNLNKLKENNE
jgi:hypothetical protein